MARFRGGRDNPGMSQTSQPESKSGSSDWVTRGTAILAVLAAIASARWGACNLEAILEQGKVNDTWAYYQAKSVKQHDAEQTRDLAAALVPGESSDRAAALERLRVRLNQEADRERNEKEQQRSAAVRYQENRDSIVERSFWFEISFASLQLGVILCTVSSGPGRRPVQVAAIVVAVIGLALLVNGFHRFVHAPYSLYRNDVHQMDAGD